ncbi:uncharacterized protein [Amphiura filiformis]|uniref:uncharacterized protein n=1 Tax=Amphiura filiformis TaxID=82378 RepID=UPI003B2240A8
MDNTGKLVFAFFLAAASLTAVTAQKCWQCTAEVRDTTDVTKQSPCVTGDLPAEGIHEMDCPEGKCIRYTSVIQGAPPYISRGCLTKRKQQLKMCDGMAGLKDISCCTGNLCNKAGANTVQFVTIVLITSSALATIFKVFY